jgi:predicted thioesterase
VEGNAVTFQIEAQDEHETIVRGSHKRAVIAWTLFSRRVSRKLSAPAK